MKFRIDCPCGDHILVSEGAAGATFTCSCGMPINVPSLSELRTRAGLPTNALSPEFIVEHLLAAGQIPIGTACIECGAVSAPIIEVTTECERAVKERSGGFSWPIFLFCLFLCQPLLIYYIWYLAFNLERPEEKEYGRDKVYPLPLPICKQCRGNLSSPDAIKKCLCKIPEYQMLLEKFPNAVVSLASSELGA